MWTSNWAEMLDLSITRVSLKGTLVGPPLDAEPKEGRGMAICTPRIDPSHPRLRLTRSGQYGPSNPGMGEKAY